MKHAILGVGAIGGLIAVALSSVGEDVTLIVRPEKVASFPRQLTLEQPDRTITTTAHAVVSQLDEVADVLWFATKTYQLQETFASVKATPRMIVPLLNGVEHMAILRAHFPPETVVAGAIAVEADRLSDGRFANETRHASAQAPPQKPYWAGCSSGCTASSALSASSFPTSTLCFGRSSASWRLLRW